MQSLLNKLNLKTTNPGACTGPNGWLEDALGEELISYDPTTGDPIGSVIMIPRVA